MLSHGLVFSTLKVMNILFIAQILVQSHNFFPGDSLGGSMISKFVYVFEYANI